MFGLIAAAGMKMLVHVPFNRRNMLVIGVPMAIAIGLHGRQDLFADASEGTRAILQSGLIPGAIASIVLNLVLPGRETKTDNKGDLHA